jgi:Flp pilus assembly protein TadG
MAISCSKGSIRKNERCGVAAVEFAILLPLIMALLFGTIEVGRLIEIQQIMSNAAREGGRQASTGQLTNAQVQQVILDYLTAASIPTANATVTVTNLTSSGVDALRAAQMDQFQVNVSLPFSDVRWVALNWFVPANQVMSAQAVWCSLKDRDYPSSSGAPPGY